MAVLKRVTASRGFQKALGVTAAEYLRLVWKTSRLVIEPADFYDQIRSQQPIITAMWHGQHFMMPFFKRAEHKGKVLISRHRDGEMNAVAAERLGVETIRGSGSHGRDFGRKGGVAAFKVMLDALAEGYNIALTADIPKVSRVAGNGIITLARLSGRPIYPVAVTTSRRVELNSWDRAEVNLPFSRCAIVVGKPVQVPAEADESVQEAARVELETELNRATARAHALADRRDD
jgi:lysophospholipid acyltransferase (LPLAT)-like uncharacterized protein